MGRCKDSSEDEKDNVNLLQCVVSHNVLSNNSLQPLLQDHHLTTAQPALNNKPTEIFVGIVNFLNCMKLYRYFSAGKQVIEAPHEIFLSIAKKSYASIATTPKMNVLAEALILNEISNTPTPLGETPLSTLAP
ncbi:uncharacterized protein LOC126482093 [Schistocerca serialis cubense]|uniref:uncharacterized protein LOC126482093 n=1 Tax=Schistocerca serialis cubense TaxID=2023355 RepID=UPI00214F1349|nr:uncharacterized protein LOC126482093 [Schistocerca serialis cubense]